MDDICRIKVQNPNNTWTGTKFYINDKDIQKVRSVDFHVGIGEIPIFVFETNGIPDIDMTGMVQFGFNPETVEQSVIVLRNELMKHGDLYNGFLAIIESVLKEQKVLSSEQSANKVSKYILGRMIGEK